MKQFQISTRNFGRYRTVQVCVYDSLAELRTAGDAYMHKQGSADRVGGNVYGLCQSFTKEKLVGKRWVKLPAAGYIRLFRGALRTGIITHECTHMALSIYQQDIQKTISNHDREEDVCYLVGDLSAKLVGRLYHYGLVPEPGK